jgi:hypothetical protein
VNILTFLSVKGCQLEDTAAEHDYRNRRTHLFQTEEIARTLLVNHSVAFISKQRDRPQEVKPDMLSINFHDKANLN